MRVLAILLLSALSTVPREWRDSIRDVYIDGKLQRGAQTLVTSSPRMFAVVCGDEVVFFDPESDAVSRAPKSAFTFAADRLTATTAPDLNGERAGAVVKVNDTTYLATLNGRTVLVTGHQGKAGPMTLEELWQTAPVWRAISDQYEPDAATIERLRAIDEPVRLQIVLATWCGDSRQHVPRLLKAITRAANPNLSVELLSLGQDFTEPVELVQRENITNVPTVVVRRGEKEIGRFVETPAGATIEADIADIAQGTPKPHAGRHERGALVTRGTYVLRDAKRRAIGTEDFEVYEKLVHSVIRKRDGTSTETFAAKTWVEVTHRAATTTRTRYRHTGEQWTAESRGADGGIINQTLVTPAALVTPATVTYAWARDAARAYVIRETGMGEVRDAKFRIAEGDVPKYVRLEDGSTRRLVTPR